MSQVDVVIPCYKYAHFLKGCVQSVLSQEGVDVRALVIDDCSPDNTAEVAAELVSSDNRVEFRRHLVNRGHIATYNEGLLEWAHGDYSLLLSADDMLTAGALRRAISVLDSHPEIGFVFGRAITTEAPDFQSVRPTEDHKYRILSGHDFWEASCEATGNLVPTPTAVVRTKLQQAIGGYRSDLPHTGDLEMWLRFAAHGSVGVLAAQQAFYRVHGKNMHKETYVADQFVLEQHRVAFEGLFREFGDRFPDAQELCRKAMCGVARGAVRRATRAFEHGHTKVCKELLSCAVGIYPGIRGDRSWKTLRLKRAIGPSGWRLVHPLVRAVRGQRLPLERHPFCSSGLIPEV